MKYSEQARELLQEAKRAVVAAGAEPAEYARLIEWPHVAAAALATGKLNEPLRGYLGLAAEDIKWPPSTRELADKMRQVAAVPTPLKPGPLLGGLIESVSGGGDEDSVELLHLAKAVWLGAPEEWRADFCKANGLDLLKAPSPSREASEATVSLGTILREVNEIHLALSKTIVGQDGALKEVSEALFKARVRDRAGDAGLPQMVFLFMGPPGVGKTFTAESLAALLKDEQGRPRKHHVFDMSSYSATEVGVMALTGFPPSYRESRAGALTGFVHDNPSAIVILDEVEKASPEVTRLLLQILGRGMLRDNHLREDVPFGKTAIVLTTNAGRTLYEDVNRTGFTFDASKVHSATILDALEKEKDSQGRAIFPKELCSRLSTGYPILFRPLQPSDYDDIVAREMERQGKHYASRHNMPIVFEDPLVRTLLVLWSGPDLDARRVEDSVGRFLSEFLMRGYQEHSDCFTWADVGKPTPIVVRVPAGGRDAEIVHQLDRACRRVLLIDDRPEFLELFRKACPAFTWFGAANTAEGCEVVRREAVDFVLQDLDLRGTIDGPLDVSGGLECLRILHEQFPRLPVFILSRALGKENFDQALYRKCVEAGGARGYIDRVLVRDGQEVEAEAFRQNLETVRGNLAREQLIREMVRSRKKVVFDVEFRRHVPSGTVHANIHDIRFEMVPTSAGRGLFSLTRPNTRFKDVAGCESAMHQLELIVKWLKDPVSFQKLGAHIKRGVLMVGPPGTGKTLLAQAVAGEADVPFVAAKASQFTTVWQASGATAIRELFAEARKHAPAIVFIDEIDAIGASRSGSSGGRESEQRQALLQLLTELDGFKDGDWTPLIVLAATNREKDLDEALERPGRFDSIVTVDLPDQGAREAILRLHARNKSVAADVDWRRLAQRTSGMSGADLAQVVNEALTLATLAGKAAADSADFNEAMNRMRYREEGKKEVSEAERSATAAHEAGHAIVVRGLLPDDIIPQISILPRGRAAGFIEHGEQEELVQSPDLRKIKARICVLMGGRAGEQAAGLSPSVGCMNDLERATGLAYSAVRSWGLSPEVGPINADKVGALLSEELKAKIDSTARGILTEAERRAVDILSANRQAHEQLIRLLLEKETVLEADLAEFWKTHDVVLPV